MIFAIVLALGIQIVRQTEADARIFGWILPPFLRMEMVQSGETFRVAEVEGNVEWIEIEDGKATVTVREKRTHAGTVRVHLGEITGGIPEIGSRVLASGDLFLYEEARNPGAFSVRGYYDSIGCYLAMTHAEIQVLSPPRLGIRHALWEFGQRLSQAVTENMSEEEAGYMNSVLFRQDAGLAEETKDAFEALNLLRLLKLTGVGLLIVGNVLYRQIRKHVRNLYLSAAAAFSGVLSYAAMTGFTPTSRRALIVFAVRLLAPAVKRRFDLPNAAALMLILMLLWEPGSITNLSVGFYIAVAVSSGIVVPAFQMLLKRYRPVTTPVLYALSTQCMLLPLILRTHYAISLIGMLLSPIFSLFTGVITATGLIGALIGSFAGKNSLSAFFFGTGHYLYRFQMSAAKAAKMLPYAEILRGCPSMLRVEIYLAVIMLVYGLARAVVLKMKTVPEKEEPNIGRKGELLFVMIFVCLLGFGIVFLKAPSAPRDGAEIVMLDVGQGDSFLIRSDGNRNYIVDCGSSSVREVGAEVLLPALRYYGISRLDGVFLSHPDEDHVNGIEALLGAENTEVAAVYVTEVANHTNQKEQIQVITVTKGITLTDGRSVFRILHPGKNSTFSGNDASMVLRFSTPTFSVLFTGDVTSEAELSAACKADVLKVAHHGSAYSTSDAFLEITSPEYALISCGQNNNYGHPAPELLKRLQEAGAEIHRTDEEGAVIVRGGRGGINVSRFR